MQLREEIVTAYNTHECPVNDWMCDYFENGSCKLKNSENKCSHMQQIKKVKRV